MRYKANKETVEKDFFTATKTRTPYRRQQAYYKHMGKEGIEIYSF